MTASTTAQTQQLAGTYNIDPAHSRIGFTARHALVTKVRGSFREFEGSFNLDPAAPSNSSAHVTINAKSIDTGNQQRDEHLRSNDFFAMDEYPEIAFASTSAERVDDTHFKLTGDLTVRAVTRPVTIDFEYLGVVQDPWGNQRVGFEGSATVNRKDWGVNWNMALEAGGVLVSDKITLEFEIAAVKTG